MIKGSEDALVVAIVTAIGLVVVLIVGLMVYALCISYIPPPLTYQGFVNMLEVSHSFVVGVWVVVIVLMLIVRLQK